MDTYDPTPINTIKKAIFDFPLPADVTPEFLRSGMDAVGEQNPPSSDISFEDVQLGGRRALKIKAPTSAEDRVIYYLHGGGYVAGSPYGLKGMLGEFARSSGATIIAPDYSKAPEAPFPAGYEESLSGLEEIARSGVSFALAGDSAGAGLALAMGVEAVQLHLTALRGLVLFSPWADLSMSSPSIQQFDDRDPVVKRDIIRWMARIYGNGVDLKDPRISPLYAKFDDLPPTLIQVGSDEALLDDAIRLDQGLRAAGRSTALEVWPEMIHVWHRFTSSLPAAHQALQRAGEFLQSKW